MITVKVIKSGNSQAIRLPKQFKLDTDEIIINRIGNVLVMTPKDEPWGLFSQGIKEIGKDFPKARKSL
ncbi:MAG: AbrB/MazE/SpoVT family DNA-binding domain-containing protein, partial [Fibrobacteria bacterium]|nr:AbrB/MazE/SpoVT family DNA-binding domain-containing protein [Fibrobacteria bacterium]